MLIEFLFLEDVVKNKILFEKMILSLINVLVVLNLIVWMVKNFGVIFKFDGKMEIFGLC